MAVSLKALEDRLTGPLKELDRLVNEGNEIGIISHEVKKSLESADHRVSGVLKLRYLLVHAHGNKGNTRQYQFWLKVLSEYGISSELVEQFTSFEGLDFEITGFDFSDNWSRQSSYDNVFVESHIPALMEVLVGCSNKWYEIGLSLKLPQYVLEDIIKTYSLHGGRICLSMILKEWVIGGYVQAESPTIENLENALTSEIAGLSAMVRNLRENLEKHGIFCMASPAPKKSRVLKRPLEIFRQTRDLIVNQGKSTLLEVQIACNVSDPVISFQWFKDGCQLKKDSIFVNSGTNKQILCIHKARLSSQGVYTCRVQLDDGLALMSDPMKVTVDVETKVSKLVSRYLQSPKYGNTWPPVSKKTYIDLVLIAHRNSLGEMPDYRMKGDVDDFIKKEENVPYKEAFGQFKGGLFLLVEGRPGSGKTTLVQKISRDWAAGEHILNGAELVFVITLRMLSKTRHTKMADILNLFYLSEKLSEEVSDYIDQIDGKGVCFLIDGLDEYDVTEGRKESLIYKIIQKEYLYQSMVIVASRPVAAGELRHRADVHLEVLGFSKTQIAEFIENYPFAGPYAAEKLNNYLDKHVNILHMCYLPVHASMICFLYDIIKENLPNTETGIYKHFTILTVLRAVKRSDKDLKLSSMDDLPVEQRNFFLQICELAFSMTSSSKQVFEAGEVDFPITCGSDVPFLGLVTVGSSTGLYDYKDLYTFVHLTFQEYLAAYFVSKMEDEEQMKILQLHGTAKHMKNMFKFYCGLATFTNDLKFLEVINAHITDSLFHCQCAFESQQPQTCECIVALNEQNGLCFKELSLTSSDLVSIDFVIKSASNLFRKFCIVECNIGGLNNLSTLSGSIKLCKELEHLDLSGNEIGDEGTEILATGLRRLIKLKYINFSRNEIGNEGLNALANGLKKCRNLVAFDVEGDFGSLEAESLEMLCDCLKENENLEILNMARHSIGDEGAEALTQCLARCNTLTTVKLDWNQIGDDGMNALVEGLRHCFNLQSFEFEGNTITSKGFKVFAESLKCWSKLKLMKFGSNEIDDDGAMVLFENLIHCCNIETILLPSSGITEASCQLISDCFHALRELKTFDIQECKVKKGSKAIIQGLKRCVGLQHLNFGITGMGVEASVALSENFKNWQNLEELVLLRNNLGGEGVRNIATGLECCTKLKKLDLSCNNIDAASSVCIAEGLKSCKSLEVLHLESNNLADEGSEAIASCFMHWQRLTYLNFYDNKIGDDGARAISANLKYLSETLELLDLSFNEIGDNGAETIADSLKNCDTLKQLKLNSNRIGDEGALLLARNLKHCKNLTILDLVENPLGEEGAQALAGNVQVDRKDFSYCNIGDVRMRDIAEELKECHDLVSLFLDNNQIGDEGAITLGKGLKNCKSLYELYLQNNNIREDGAKGLMVGLKCCDIGVLQIGNNHIGDAGVNSLAEGLICCTNLERLYLEKNSIADQGAEGLAKILEACTNIEWIDLKHNLIGSEGAIVFSKSLKYGENLKTLNIDHNFIGDKGCAAFSKNFKPGNNLKHLNLTQNNIGDFGAKELSKSLKHLQLLKDLYLSDNEISADGAIHLADGLKYCCSLQVFHIDNNCIGDSVIHLAKGLKHCSNLESVSFDNNSISDNGAKSLAKILKRCKNLSEMSLKYNLVLNDGIRAIAESMQPCTQGLTIHTDPSKLSQDTILYLAGKLNSDEVDFSDCGISATFFESLLEKLENCTGLERLNLSHNQIEDGMENIVLCLKSFSFLASICLDNNHITDASVKHLVSSLKECDEVTDLSLQNNLIGDEGAEFIGTLLSLDFLNVLDLGSNRISPCGVKAMLKSITCTSLVSLDIGFNLIGDNGAMILASALINCSSLSSLVLDHNQIGDDGAIALSTLPQHCRYLSSVSLAYNSISHTGIKQFASSIQDVKSLNLSDNCLHNNGIKTLLQSVKGDYKLEVLYLGNNVGSDKAISDIFMSHNTIKVLALDHNRIGEVGIRTLAKGLKSLHFLTSLILDHNKLNDDCIGILADGLIWCFRLKVLSLEYNRISDDGIKSLAENLELCYRLKELNLGSNIIGDNGTEHFLPLISSCKYLELVNLSFNKISDTGATILANVTCRNLSVNLAGNPCTSTFHCIGKRKCIVDEQFLTRQIKFGAGQQMLKLKSFSFHSSVVVNTLCQSLENANNLQMITLENCELDDGILKVFEKGLSHCAQLRKLHLPVNQIGDAGARVLAGCLKMWSYLQDLCLAQNTIGDEGIAEIAESLEQCEHITLLNFERNRIGDRGAAIMCKSLKNLHSLRELSMEDNMMSDKGIEMLDDEFEDCQNLKMFLQVP